MRGGCCSTAEADGEVTGFRSCVKAIRTPHLVDTEEVITPRSPAQDSGVSCFRSFWILRAAVLVIIGCVPIGTPFKDVASGVIKPISVGREAADR